MALATFWAIFSRTHLVTLFFDENIMKVSRVLFGRWRCLGWKVLSVDAIDLTSEKEKLLPNKVARSVCEKFAQKRSPIHFPPSR
jgi:hypothetical protein